MNQQRAAFTSRVYRKGAYVTVENTKDNNFYIIKSGAIQIYRSFLDTIFSKKVLKKGDFFGLIGTLTGHPHTESALVVDNSEIIVVQRSQFMSFISQAPSFATNILHSFSKELRLLDSELAKRILKETHNKDDATNLYELGSFYYEHKEYDIAQYIHIQFIKHYPTHAKVEVIKNQLLSFPGFDISKYHTKESDIQRYKDREMIFSEFEPGYATYVIKSGQVKITKIVNDKEVLLAVLNKGDFFGEMAILESANRAASAISYGDTECLVIRKGNFNSFIIGTHSQISEKLITLLSERIWSVGKQLETLLFEDPYNKLYHTLYTELLKQHITIQANKQYTFPFGIDEVKKMTGIIGTQAEQAIERLFENDTISILENNQIHCNDLIQIQKEIEYMTKIKIRKTQFESN